jgi:hypothetical protein
MPLSVSGPTNCAALRVITGSTRTPACTSRRATITAL